MKRIICLLSVLLLLFMSCGPKEEPSIATKPPATKPPETTAAPAETQTEAPTETPTEAPTETEVPTEPALNPDGHMMTDPGVFVTAESYCVVDDRLRIVTGKDELSMRAPASITKVLTCLLVCELAGMDEVVTVSEQAVNDVALISSGVYPSLKPGERFTVEELLYILMIPSTNAAANVLAEHVAGSETHFVQLMNTRVSAMGLTHSHFMNAHGLDEGNHFTCAFDMAVIMKHAVENDNARRIMSTVQYTVPATEYTAAREMAASNALLNGSMTCPGIIGSKNGFTLNAQATVVAACEREGKRLYCCTMHSVSNYQYTDAANLLDASYGFLTGKRASRHGFLYDMRFTDADEESILIRAKATDDIVSVRAVYWKDSEGTGAAKTVEGIRPSDDIGVLLPVRKDAVGSYIIQLFYTDADGHEDVQVRGLLFTGEDPVKGFQPFYGYTYYVDDDGFTPSGAEEMKDCAYYLSLGRVITGFAGPYYFAGEDGRIVSGWFESSHTRYYAGADGRVVTGDRIIDGVLYHFNEYGALEE